MDVRKPPKKYVADKMQEVVEEAFQVRRKLEKNMNRRELLAFDKVLGKYLEPENLLKRLEAAIEQDYSLIFQGKQMVETGRQQKSNQEEQLLKEPNKQRAFNKSIKNEDALFKQMAFVLPELFKNLKQSIFSATAQKEIFSAMNPTQISELIGGHSQH